MTTEVLGGAEFGDWERADHYKPHDLWARTASHRAGSLALSETLTPLGMLYEVGDGRLHGDGTSIGTMAMREQFDMLRTQLEPNNH